MSWALAIVAASLAALAAGCATGPRYACSAPAGVGCKPVSEVYAASVAGEIADADPAPGDAGTDTKRVHLDNPAASPPGDPGRPVVATVRPGSPILTPPKVLRVWIAPWEDENGDLHDETYLYLRLDEGQWVLTP
jgi:conjugal transfer pilus assembly protein TraV